MFGNIAENSGKCAEFDWIVQRDRYVKFAALSSCHSQVTSGLPADKTLNCFASSAPETSRVSFMLQSLLPEQSVAE